MKSAILPFLIVFSFSVSAQEAFRNEQKRYPRVREAYAEKSITIFNNLEEKGIDPDDMRIYLRAFKAEKKLELWGKNKNDEQYTLLDTYDICRTSGILGPKRQQGDLQIPEGYYHITVYNPASNFHLSMAINYPNKSDRILGVKGNLGGNICIHGACVTIGCIPIRNDKIKELYLYCIEAKANGQSKIPVTIMPRKMTDPNYEQLLSTSPDSDKKSLWTDLKAGYDFFERTKTLPSITFLENGRHQVK